MAFNKIYKRKGNLFSRTFKRVEISKDSQFTQALVYIHPNAQKHQLMKKFILYPWTLYHSTTSDKPTKILRTEVLNWFGGKAQFQIVHKEMSDSYYNFSGTIKDDDH